MKKLLSILGILMLVCMFTATMAMANPQPKDPAGYYQHTVTGEIKYFKNGHPGDPSQWTYLGDNNGGECGNGNCPTLGSFHGEFSQSTSAGIYDGDDVKVKNGDVTIKDGAFASGGEESNGAYFGDYKGSGGGIGVTGGLGGTVVFAKDFGDLSLAGGATGNLQLAAVGGDLDHQCANVDGNGNMLTFAIENGNTGGAVANTSGAFAYNAQGPNVAVGGGLTGGISAAHVGNNAAAAGAGGITISGAGSF